MDARTYDRLQALFAGRKRGRVAGVSYVGTGILRCVCGVKLTARTQRDATYKDGQWRYQYYCAKQRRGCGTVFIDGRATDAELLTYTVERLSDEQHAQEVEQQRTQTDNRLKQVHKEIKEVSGLQAGIAARLGKRTMSIDLARLTAERDALEAADTAGPTAAASAGTGARAISPSGERC